MSIESMVRALQTPDLSPSEKLLLLGIANHDGDGGAWPSIATLAGYVGVQVRQVQKLITALEDKGLVTRHLNGGGTTRTRADHRPNLFTLHFDGVSSSAPRGVSSTTPETPSEPSGTSSLRSDGDVREESGSDDHARGDESATAPDEPGRRMATAFWDSFVVASGGLRPSTPFIQLAAVARKALKAGLTEDEVVAGMLATKVMTGEAVVKEAVHLRRATENRPATGQIDRRAVSLMTHWKAHQGSRNLSPAKIERDDEIACVQALSTMLLWPSMSEAEVGARFGGFARANPSWRLPTIDDLRAVPLGSRPLRPDDVDAAITFLKYANGPRLTA